VKFLLLVDKRLLTREKHLMRREQLLEPGLTLQQLAIQPLQEFHRELVASREYQRLE
jgi:hypothetical protein